MEKRMNTEAVLAKLAEIRRSIPRLNDTPRPEKTSRIDAQSAEELARDPAHANVILHVEALRKAHQNSYGRTIPTKEETEARRGKPREEGSRSGSVPRSASRRQA